MTTFWVAAAVLTAAALIMIVPALLGRVPARGRTVRELNLAVYRDRLADLRAALEAGDVDTEEFELAKADLDAGLLNDVPDEDGPGLAPASPAHRGRWLGAVVALALPLAGAALYANLGTPAAIGEKARAIAPPGASAPGSQGEMLPSVDEMVAGLERRLRDAPDDAEGWLTLGRSFMVMQRYPDAAEAYRRAQELVGEVPDVMVDRAEAIALGSEQRLLGPAGEIAARALEIAPDHPKALWLNGFAARQRGDIDRALALWTRLTELLPQDSQQRQVVVGLIREAGGEAAPDAPDTGGGATASVTVAVSLDPSLVGDAQASDTLYVFARAVDGPPMPLAIARLTVADLPATVVLDDSLSMVPTARLSGFEQVVIGARVSKSGDPMPGSGDLQGVSDVITVAEQREPVAIRIDQRLP